MLAYIPYMDPMGMESHKIHVPKHQSDCQKNPQVHHRPFE